MTSFQSKLMAMVRSDPKKAGVLGVLLAVLALLAGRAALGSKPSPASAKSPPRSLPAKSPVAAAPTNRMAGAIAALQKWAEAPVPPVSRNLFSVCMDYFPVDGSRAVRSDQTGDGFWLRLEKSMALQADQRDKRQNLIANYKAQAASLRLVSTMMGPQPKAMVNAELVGEGSVVAGFRVLKIEARRIIVEREGIRLEIQMK